MKHIFLFLLFYFIHANKRTLPKKFTPFINYNSTKIRNFDIF